MFVVTITFVGLKYDIYILVTNINTSTSSSSSSNTYINTNFEYL